MRLGVWLQKPKDLEGVCPFSDVTAVCPYGFACRYSGSHPEVKGIHAAEVLKDGNHDSGKNSLSSIRELNSLNKTFQKSLWKNAVTFPKADAQLQALGLLVRFHRLIMRSVYSCAAVVLKIWLDIKCDMAVFNHFYWRFYHVQSIFRGVSSFAFPTVSGHSLGLVFWGSLWSGQLGECYSHFLQ